MQCLPRCFNLLVIKGIALATTCSQESAIKLLFAGEGVLLKKNKALQFSYL